MNEVVKTGGGQIGNKNAEKWTEEEALKLGYELIDWLRQETDGKNPNIFFSYFLMVNKKMHKGTINYLETKFRSFSDLIKTATLIQELKLVDLGVKGRLSNTMAIFVLKNMHRYQSEVEPRREDEQDRSKEELLCGIYNMLQTLGVQNNIKDENNHV